MCASVAFTKANFKLRHYPQPSIKPVRYIEPKSFSDPEKAARKLVEIANAAEAVQDGRIHIELINAPFLKAGYTPAE